MSIPATISVRSVVVGVSPWAIGGLRVARERIRIEPHEGLNLVIVTEACSLAVVYFDLVASSVTGNEHLRRVVDALTMPRRAPLLHGCFAASRRRSARTARPYTFGR